MFNRPKDMLKLVKEDLKDLKEYFEEGEKKKRDCIQKLYQIYENAINIIKDVKNGMPEKIDHKRKTALYEAYYSIGILKKNYSITHKRLDDLRKSAAFGSYAVRAIKLPELEEIRDSISEAESLVKEIEAILTKKIS